MTWEIKYLKSIRKDFGKIDHKSALKIKKFLEETIANSEDPRIFGKALKGKYQLWRYRVGNYRIICEIKNNEVTILVLRIAHRKDVYKK